MLEGWCEMVGPEHGRWHGLENVGKLLHDLITIAVTSRFARLETRTKVKTEIRKRVIVQKKAFLPIRKGTQAIVIKRAILPLLYILKTFILIYEPGNLIMTNIIPEAQKSTEGSSHEGLKKRNVGTDHPTQQPYTAPEGESSTPSLTGCGCRNGVMFLMAAVGGFFMEIGRKTADLFHK
ncbi:hypothetical protein G9A89_016886 [Geosiphon pyriformis]|nr:hypothetical protein G9A89_016886 [Geosiphon pyriformis]